MSWPPARGADITLQADLGFDGNVDAATGLIALNGVPAGQWGIDPATLKAYYAPEGAATGDECSVVGIDPSSGLLTIAR